jgi:alkyl sulfatase BDS1-like metallo-beta-lactamase superfamily hydrolase
MDGPKDATESTRRANADNGANLPDETGADLERARRGFIATLADTTIRDEQGAEVWDIGRYAFAAEGKPAPATVHPGLWRQAGLNAIHGLFRVTDRIVQVRGLDLSNITFVEGDRGYIVIDPLISAEPARAALDLVRSHLGDRPVVAVIYTHSHVDHWGGVRGVLTEADLARGDVPITAPEGFFEHAVSENILLGNAMGRRASYMYGALLEPGPRGHVDAGLGKTVSMGSVSLVPPTETITATGQRLTVDGVEIVFQLTPDAEAPAEMNFFFPQLGALCMAENTTAHLHNVYTPRGAQVRDARAWSFFVNQAIELFGDRTEVLFATHHWPRWGRHEVLAYLTKQRDLYRYVHDQTLRLANHGHTAVEIAEMVELPPSLAEEWHTRGFYGTVNHNVKAVYQRYLGWFDGNPAHLHPLTPVEAGARYVELAGGAAELLRKARQAFEAGDYRWVAEVVNHLVFADPANLEARHLQADALEQLGYQAESGPWRSFYLTAALELRATEGRDWTPRFASPGVARALPTAMLFELLAVRLNGPEAAGHEITVNFSFTDTNERYLVTVENAVLHAFPDRHDPKARAGLVITRTGFVDLLLGAATAEQLLGSGELEIEGDAGALIELMSLLDTFDFWFGIVTP